MKIRHGFMFLVCAALVVTGCGSDSKDKDDKKLTKAEKAVQADRDNKEKAVDRAEKDFKKNKKDVGACRNLAMSYVALASPASTSDPKKAPEVPKDRDDSLKKSISTLKDCAKIDGDSRDVKQMLASSLMGTNQYKEASKLLKELATTAKGPERANAYYQWGLASSNAQDMPGAIAAFRNFVRYAPAKDPRVPQVKQSIKALAAASRQQAQAKAAAEEDDAPTKTEEESAEG